MFWMLKLFSRNAVFHSSESKTWATFVFFLFSLLPTIPTRRYPCKRTWMDGLTWEPKTRPENRPLKTKNFGDLPLVARNPRNVDQNIFLQVFPKNSNSALPCFCGYSKKKEGIICNLKSQFLLFFQRMFHKLPGILLFCARHHKRVSLQFFFIVISHFSFFFILFFNRIQEEIDMKVESARTKLRFRQKSCCLQ